jgi:hypothetical protein
VLDDVPIPRLVQLQDLQAHIIERSGCVVAPCLQVPHDLLDVRQANVVATLGFGDDAVEAGLRLDDALLHRMLCIGETPI